MTIGSTTGDRVRDRSVPRTRVAAGDRSTDRRGRIRSAPAILSYGFRPFFLGGALYAAFAVPLWLWLLSSGAETAGPFSGSAWHAHEMIFGYLAAIIAGFALTAVPNWTGRLPLSGLPLAILFATWLAGRLATFTVSAPLGAFAVDIAFTATLAAAVWREVIAGKNWRNAPVALLITLFAMANALYHAGNFWLVLDGFGMRLALGVVAMLIALIGGRITPSFTRNWLAKRKAANLPASFGRIDQLALAATALGIAGWILLPTHVATGALLMGAGALLLGRLVRWKGLGTWREPIVLILHVGYFWLAVSLLMLGCSIISPDTLPESAALHALTAGAIATMTLAVMTRASRGHTGRPIEADAATIAIYVLVTAGALIRIAAPFWPDVYSVLLVAGGLTWSLSFVAFAIRYGPMLVRRS
jgi:uncharacterized protein involved in response to NO